MRRISIVCMGLVFAPALVAGGEGTAVVASGSTTPRTIEERAAELINVKDFGANGGDEEDDTAAILAAIKAIKARNGGTLLFPDGDYRVAFPQLPHNGAVLFALPSNTRVVFGAGARMIPETIPPTAVDIQYVGLFGADLSAPPVTNLAFEGLNVHADPAVSGSIVGLSPVQLAVGHGTAKDQITNVRISNCRFDTGLGIYILNQLDPAVDQSPLDRQVRGVKISNCTITHNGTITADANDVEITNLTAEGTNSPDTYDAISIHAGVNIRIHGGSFRGFGGMGNAINIRNHPETGYGTAGVVVSGATFHDIPTDRAAISVALAEDRLDEMHGTQNVTIANNTFTNVVTGIVITPGYSRLRKVPLRTIAISGNVFQGVSTAIAATANPAAKYIHGLSITGNTINTAATAAYPAIQLNAVQLASITGNHISHNNGGLALEANLLEYSAVAGNTIVSSARMTASLTNLRTTTITGNMIYGSYVIRSAAMDNVVSGNRFAPFPRGTESAASEVDGRTGMDGHFTLEGPRMSYLGSTWAGAWRPGDLVWNPEPAASTPPAWVNTAEGWRPMAPLGQ